MPFVSFSIVFILIVTLLFSIHAFVSKSGIKYYNYLLGFYLLARFAHVGNFLLIDNELIVYVPFLLKLFCPLIYVAPSFVYLYIVALVNNQTHLRKIDYWHFLPGLISIVDDIPWYFSPSINWDTIAQELIRTKNIAIVAETGLFPSEVYLYYRPIIFTIYLILSFTVFFKSELSKKKNGSSTKRLWLLSALITVTTSHILTIFGTYFRDKGTFFDENQKLYIWIAGIGLIFIFTNFLLLIYNPKILYGYILTSLGEKNKLLELEHKARPVGSSVTTSQSDLEFIKRVQNYMIHEKPFLSSSFRIIDLANAFQIPIHQCSALINKHIGNNFNDWVNHYRIKYFIQSYPSKSEKLTIDAIAYESGFKSVTTFYRSFKKETGKMPLQYFSD
jgi:AraC-like DNA-binding protein